MRLIFRKFYQMRFYRRKIYFYGTFQTVSAKFPPFFATIKLTSLVKNLVKSLTKSAVKNRPPGNKKARRQIKPSLAFLHCNAPLGGCFAFVKPAYKFRTGIHISLLHKTCIFLSCECGFCSAPVCVLPGGKISPAYLQLFCALCRLLHKNPLIFLAIMTV